MLYEAYTGRDPVFEGDTLNARSIRGSRGAHEDHLLALLRQCLMRDPAKRPTVEQALRAEYFSDRLDAGSESPLSFANREATMWSTIEQIKRSFLGSGLKRFKPQLRMGCVDIVRAALTMAAETDPARFWAMPKVALLDSSGAIKQAGLDLGGLAIAMFDQVFRYLPQLPADQQLLESDDQDTFLPVEDPSNLSPAEAAPRRLLYVGLGRLLAAAIWQRIRLPIAFAPSMMKVLLRREGKLRLLDVNGFSNKFYRSLCALREFEAAEFATGVFQLANGDAATTETREQYLREEAHRRLYSWRCQAFEAIREGFEAVCDGLVAKLLRNFTAEEACDLVEGEQHPHADDVARAFDCFDGFGRSSSFPTMFANAVRRLQGVQLNNLLIYCTSQSALDRDTGIRVRMRQIDPGQALIPEAHTCSRTLDFPEDATEEAIFQRLLLMVRHCHEAGFGLA